MLNYVLHLFPYNNRDMMKKTVCRRRIALRWFQTYGTLTWLVCAERRQSVLFLDQKC